MISEKDWFKGISPEDRLKKIFINQENLMEIISKKELATDPFIHIPELPVDLNDRLGQRYIREIGARFIEELGEALNTDTKADLKEELIDCLHFLVELSIVVDFAPFKVVDTKAMGNDYLDHLALVASDERIFNTINTFSLDDEILKVFKLYGKLMNLLRSKPWKANYVETNKMEFFNTLLLIWISFMSVLYYARMNTEDIWNIYYDKNKVNLERQENGY